VLTGVWSAASVAELSFARLTCHVVTILRLFDVLWTAGALLHLSFLYKLFKLFLSYFLTSVTKLKNTEAGGTKLPIANLAIK